MQFYAAIQKRQIYQTHAYFVTLQNGWINYDTQTKSKNVLPEN